MQFERIRKSHKRKIIIGGLILVCVISAITITTTRAKYKITQDIPLAKGTVNYNPDKTKPVVSNIVSSVTETEITVTVSASDNVGVTEYWYSIDNGAFQKGTSNTYRFTGLKASTSYTIKVYVKDGAGNQSDTTTKTIKTTDTTKPIISSVTTTVTKTEINVTVSASDNVGVTEYWYQMDSNTVVKGTGNTHKFTGLAAGTTHTVKVYVKDAAGNQSTTTTKSNITTTAPSGSEAILGNITVKPGTPNFSKIATTDEGVYSVSDPVYGGTSYYWRGAVTNNYVKFGGFCWRIIRINGDRSIRMIYDGSTCHANGTSTSESLAVTGQAYNSNSRGSEYVGYTYTTGSQRTLSGTASNLKTQTDSWYNNNLASYASKIADGKFCNDRNVASGSSWSSQPRSTLSYAAEERLYTNKTPTLACNSGDVYTLKVGTITADEVVYAGEYTDGAHGPANRSYYLYNGQPYWTMTPYYTTNYPIAGVFFVSSDGYLTSTTVNETARGLRPVINLKADVIFSGGNGTLDNPYVVQ